MMTTTDRGTKPGEDLPIGIKPFKEFSWLPENLQTPDRILLERAKDSLTGTAMAMKLIELASLEDDRASGAYLNMYERGALERFAIASCELLQEAIDLRFDHIREGTKGSARGGGAGAAMSQ
jgi:hypothetical protein